MTIQNQTEQNSQPADLKEGWRIEKVERNGIVIETTYDEQGRPVEVVKRIKPDPRQSGPVDNREQRPL